MATSFRYFLPDSRILVPGSSEVSDGTMTVNSTGPIIAGSLISCTTGYITFARTGITSGTKRAFVFIPLPGFELAHGDQDVDIELIRLTMQKTAGPSSGNKLDSIDLGGFQQTADSADFLWNSLLSADNTDRFTGSAGAIDTFDTSIAGTITELYTPYLRFEFEATNTTNSTWILATGASESYIDYKLV